MNREQRRRKSKRVGSFDGAFRLLCNEKGVRAAYVLVEGTVGDQGVLRVGGDADLAMSLKAMLKPVDDAPPKETRRDSGLIVPGGYT